MLTTTGAVASAWDVEFTGYLVGSKVDEFLDVNALSPGVIEAQQAARRVRLTENENRCDDLLREFASKRSFKLALEHVKSNITSKLGYILTREVASGAHSAPSAKSALNLRAMLTQTGLDAPWVGLLEAAQTEYSGASQSSRVFKREDLADESSAQSALNRLNRFVEKLGPKKGA